MGSFVVFPSAIRLLLASKLSPTTNLRLLAAKAATYCSCAGAMLSHVVPLCGDGIELLLRGVKRYLGTAVQRKAPITPRLLLRIVHLFDFDKPLHVAMWALFLVAFYSFLRKSNLVVDCVAQVSPRVLLQSDLCFDASFAYLTIRASKTIQFQERLFSLPLPPIRVVCCAL